MTWKPTEISLDADLSQKATDVASQLDDAVKDERLAEAPTFVAGLEGSRLKLLDFAKSATSLRSTGASVVFVAPKGAGKSSVLNGLLGLWVGGEPPKGANADTIVECSVLPLGAGGTTPCEVHFRHGPDWSVEVEGEPEATVLKKLDGLAGSAYRSALKRAKGENARGENGDDDFEETPRNTPAHSATTPHEKILLEPGLEQDISRCLRGVCGLTETALRELADKHLREDLGADGLRDELVRRASYSTRVDLKLQPETTGDEPLVWLKKVLEKLTWGTWPSQPFPRRIVVHVPGLPCLGDDGSPVRFIDSLGLPAVSKGGEADASPLNGRADLRPLLGDPWAAAVFVAGYTNPPDAVATAIVSAFSGDAPLVPPHRAVASLLYKGEPILIDRTTDEPPAVQKANDARNKRDDVAVPNVNNLLGRAKKPQEWSGAQSPVVDLTRSLGSDHVIEGLQRAIDDRFLAMANRWHEDTRAELTTANALLKLANEAPEIIENAFRTFKDALRPALTRFAKRIKPLEACPVLPFAVACNSRPAGGWLYWGTVNSMGRNNGRGTRNAFEILAEAVRKDYVQPEVTELQHDILKAEAALLYLNHDALTREMIKQAADAQRTYAGSLLEHLPVAFAHAFEAVADELVDTEQCAWLGGPRSIMGVRYGADRPLGPNWYAGLKAWGELHQEKLWCHVLDYLKEKKLTLPG